MPVHPLYPLSEPLVRTTHYAVDHPRALRVLHGLLHALARHHDTLTGAPVAPPEEGYHAITAELRARVGLGGARGNREIEDGLDALRRRGLVHDYRLLNRGQDLVWWHLDVVLERMAVRQPYGLHDIRAVAALERALPIMWYSETVLVRRMLWPRFKLDVDLLGRVHGRQSVLGTTPPWRATHGRRLAARCCARRTPSRRARGWCRS